MRAMAMLMAAFLSAACGMGLGDADGSQDAGTGAFCELVLRGPNPMTVGQEAVFEVEVVGGDGLHLLDWSISRGGELIEPLLEDGSTRARFTPDEAGPYRIAVTGTVGPTSCTPAVTDANALAEGTPFVDYRLRVVPPQGSGAPPQIIAVELPMGSDYSLSSVLLESGVVAEGTITAAGAPVAAYVRATRIDDPVPATVETFAGDDGRYALRLADGTYRFRVVPRDPGIAPREVTASAESLGGAVELDAGATVTGTVTRGGAPVAGARVSLVVDGVPSSLAQAAADGSFSIAVQQGFELSLQVAPPAASALPALELAEVGADLAGGAALAIDYASAAPVAVDAVVQGPDGPLAGARTVWIASDLPGAAEARLDGGAAAAMRGRVRRTAVASGAGRVALSLPPGVYQVAVQAEGLSGVATVDLGAGAPASIAVPAAATIEGRLVDAGGAPLAGVVRARPRGVLAAAAVGAASARIGADGSFALEVAGGAVFDLSLLPGEGRAGRVFRELTTTPGEAVALGQIAAPAAVTASGQLLLPGGQPVAGAQLSLLCDGCGGLEASRPLAEAVSDAAGRFALRAADPGSP